MEVDEPQHFHIDSSSDDSFVRVMLSDEWAEGFQWVYSKLLDSGIISISIDSINVGYSEQFHHLEQLADQLLTLLTFELGPARVQITLLAFALSHLLGKFVVTGYEVTETPKPFGDLPFGKGGFGRGRYAIEPVTLD